MGFNQTDIPNSQIDPKTFNLLNQSILILMLIFIFLYPFPRITAIKEICFYLSILVVIILLICHTLKFSFVSPLSIPFGLFIIWASIGFFFAINKENTLHDIYGHLLKYIILYYILINFLNSKRLFYVLLWTIIISLGVTTLSCMIYFYIIQAMPITTRLGIPKANIPINSIGLIAGPSLLLGLSMFNQENKLYLKLVLLFFILTSFLSILLSGTIGAIIGSILPLFILLPKNKRKISVFILFFLILLSLLPTKYFLSIELIKLKLKIRPAIWYSYFQVIKERPVMGTGFGMQIYDPKFLEKCNANVPAKYKVQHPYHPHNILIDITVRTGIVGLLLFSYIIVSSLKVSIKTVTKAKDHFIKNWANCITAVFTSILIQSMFTDVLLSKQAYLIYLTLSLITILWRLNVEALNLTK